MSGKNSIVHKDYSIFGSDIKVAVYDSRIEIVFTGALPKGITVEDVVGGRSERIPWGGQASKHQ